MNFFTSLYVNVRDYFLVWVGRKGIIGLTFFTLKLLNSFNYV